MKRKLFAISLILSLIPLLCFAQKKEHPQGKQKHLAIISAYNEAAPWPRQYISLITREISKNDEFRAVTVTPLNNIIVHDREDFDQLQDGLFESFRGNKPDYLVLIGNFAFCLRERIRQEWGDIPILLIAQNDKYGPIDYYMTDLDAKDSVTPPPALRPLEELRSLYNFTLVQTPNKPKETVDMMVNMFPHMKKLVFMSDPLYLNRHLNYIIREYVGRKYPNIEYEWLVATDDSSMQPYLNNKDVSVGLLLSTWYYVAPGLNGSQLMRAGDSYLIAGASRPVFGLRYSYLPYGVVGGYFSPPEELNRDVLEALHALVSDRNMRDIPFYIPKTAYPIINYPKFEALGLRESICPPGTRFVDKPKTDWERYGIYVYIGCGVFILIIVFLIGYIVQMKRRALIKQQYDDLVESMPIGYQKVLIETDSYGKLASVVLGSNNKAFADLMESHNLSGNDRIRSKAYWQEVVDAIYSTHETVKSVFRTSADHGYIEFLMYLNAKSTDEKPVIDVFAIDVSDKMKIEQVLRDAARKTAEADDMMTTVLEDMGNEIRPPLTAIVEFAGILCKTDDPETKKKCIEMIEANNSLLLNLLDDMLAPADNNE